MVDTMSKYSGYSALGAMNQSGGSIATGFFGSMYVGFNQGSLSVCNLSGSGMCNVGWKGALYLGNQTTASDAFDLGGSGLLSWTTELRAEGAHTWRESPHVGYLSFETKLRDTTRVS
jgi:hypothetical protein